MTHVAIFVVGSPGVGKTSALRTLLPFYHTLNPAPKWTLAAPVAMVGHYGAGTFDGGDTVPYNGARAAVRYWQQFIVKNQRYEWSVFDGDRFSTANVREAVEATPGVRVVCVHLTCNEEALAARRSNRNNTQNESWMVGRATKALRFAESFGQRSVRLDTSDMSVIEVGSALRSLVSEPPQATL